MFQLLEIWARGEGMQKSEILSSLQTAASSFNLYFACPKPKEVCPEEPKTTTTTVSNKAKGTVLLQTAKATAVSDVPSETASFRILLDTGKPANLPIESEIESDTSKVRKLHHNTFGMKDARSSDVM